MTHREEVEKDITKAMSPVGVIRWGSFTRAQRAVEALRRSNEASSKGDVFNDTYWWGIYHAISAMPDESECSASTSSASDARGQPKALSSAATEGVSP